MVRVALAGMLVAACAGRASTTVPETSLDPDPIDHPALAPGLAIPEPLLGVPLHVRDVVGRLWFADEQLDAAKIIAQWARGVGLTVDDPTRTRELFARAERGQDVTTGAACGGPLWHLPAAERWRVELHAQGRIEARIACAATCTLQVTIAEGIDAGASDAGRGAMWTTPFDPARPWRDELAQRLWEITGPPSVPDAVAVPRAPEPLPDSVLAGPRACLGDVGAVGVLLETSARGAVTRCESFTQTIIGNGPVAACACKALVGAVLQGGARRVATTVSLAEVPVARSGAGRPLRAGIVPALRRDATGQARPIVSDRSVRDWAPPSPWTIAACFAGAPDAALPVNAKVVVTVGGSRGRVTHVDVTELVGTLTADQRACVTTAVKKHAKIPCPSPGSHTLEADLVVDAG